MNKYIQIAKKIKDTYERNLFTISLEKQSHFSLRMYRISGDKKYLVPIINNYIILSIKALKYINNFNNKKFIKKEAESLFKEFSTGNDFKERTRKKVFLQLKEFLVFSYLLNLLRYWKDFNVLDKSLIKGVNCLKKIDFGKYLLNEQLIECYGTQLINILYKLDRLKICNLKKSFSNKFKKIFMKKNDQQLENLDYQNKIYGLTHFIIAESFYYQRWVSADKNKWILDYFYNNINQILKRTYVDIIAEVGLCFLLCRKNNQKVLKKVKNYLIKNFNKKAGYIPIGKKKTLDYSEHMNIISYMVLNGIKDLSSGPNLKNYFKKI